MWPNLGDLFTNVERVTVPLWHPDTAHQTAIAILRRTKWTREMVKLLLDIIQLGYSSHELLETFGTLQECEDMNNAICSLYMYHLWRMKASQRKDINTRSAVYHTIDRVFKSKERLEE
jgi:hypothetical protein